MSSVTQRIKQVKQPYGGYLKLNSFEKKDFIDNKTLKEENIHSSLVGLVVDYLTRFMLGTEVEEAFKISILGAEIIGEEQKAYLLLRDIKGLDNISIYNACKLVGYDVCFRAGRMGYKEVDNIEADNDTINNIKIMVNRSIQFFKRYGPITKDGFTFEGGYTSIINAGDGDFLTKDTLWDFKVSKNNPTSAHTLQLLIYYIMGVHSIHDEFKTIKKLGIFNPRMNCIYLKNILDIPQETINEVSEKIIGYNENSLKNVVELSENENSFKNVVESSENENSFKNVIKPSENEDLLSMTDIMKVLSCSRYMVMKYYSENDLPLFKIKNKYFVDKYDLIEWIRKLEDKRKQQQVISLIILIIFIIFIIAIFDIIIKK